MKQVVVWIALLLVALPVHAGVGESGFWFTGSGFYATGKSKAADKFLHGAGVAATLEGMRGANLSLGLSLGYASIDGDGELDGTPTRFRISSMPAYLVVRYWLGEVDQRTRGYVGGAAGVYISFLDTTDKTTGRLLTDGNSGAAFAVPVGAMITLDPRLSLNLNYTLNWMVGNDYLSGGITHVVGLGLGFTLAP